MYFFILSLIRAYTHVNVFYIVECNEDEFQCPEGLCISSSYLCDGVDDCPLSEADEENCATGKVIWASP